MIEMDGSDNDAELRAWNNRYGVKYPGCSKDGGAATVENNFDISGFPSVRVVAPDKTLLYSGNWATNVRPKLVSAGVEEHTCDTPTVIDNDFINETTKRDKIVIGNVTAHKINVTVPSDGNYNLHIYTADGKLNRIISDTFLSEGSHEVTWNSKGLATGVVFIELKSGSKKIIKKAIIY